MREYCGKIFVHLRAISIAVTRRIQNDAPFRHASGLRTVTGRVLQVLETLARGVGVIRRHRGVAVNAEGLLEYRAADA